MPYAYVDIAPAPGGFGEYQCTQGDVWDDADDLLDEVSSTHHRMYELDDENVAAVLPGQVEDIRGRIREEPDRVFAILHDDGHVSYFGIVEQRPNE